MEDLKQFLITQGYFFAKLKKTATNHFEIKATLNGIKGTFIIDTGASNTCVGLNEIETFNISSTQSDEKAAGAGSTDIDTRISSNNHLKIGRYKISKVKLVLIDLGPINSALKNHKSTPIHGIIGADVLLKGNAIIDYKKKGLYLKS